MAPLDPLMDWIGRGLAAQKAVDAEIAKAAPAPYRPEGYVLVTAVNSGHQVAFVLGHREKNGAAEIKLVKWRRQGRLWTNPAWYPVADVEGPALPADLQRYKVGAR